MEEIKNRLRIFNKDRDWEKYHTPENLAKSVSIEAGELLECFQWGGEYDSGAVADEIADVMMYCIMLADKLGFDMKKEMMRKLQQNAAKYPVEKCKGKSLKYDQLDEINEAAAEYRKLQEIADACDLECVLFHRELNYVAVGKDAAVAGIIAPDMTEMLEMDGVKCALISNLEKVVEKLEEAHINYSYYVCGQVVPGEEYDDNKYPETCV